MRYRPKRTNKIKSHFDLWIMRIAATLGCLTMISAYLLSGVYARFSSEATGEDSARVAKYAFDVSTTGNSEFSLDTLSSIAKPGDSATVEFTVTNGDSEVSQKYNISVSDFGNLPLQYTLTKEDGTTVSLDNGTTGDTIFQAGVNETHKYTLTVTWNTDEKSYDLIDEIDLVTVVVDAEQID